MVQDLSPLSPPVLFWVIRSFQDTHVWQSQVEVWETGIFQGSNQLGQSHFSTYYILYSYYTLSNYYTNFMCSSM